MAVSCISRPSWRALKYISPISIRYSHHGASAAPFPTIPSCPPSSCTCAPMPVFPEGLEVDHSKPLNGTMAPYAEQLLVCTGQADWPSKVEDDHGGENLVADVKELIGRGGEYADPYHNTPLTATSFLPTPPPPSIRDVETTSAYLLPSFTYLPVIPRSTTSVTALVKGYLQPARIHSAHSVLSPIHQDRLRRSEAHRALLPAAQEVDDVLVLICGHGGRDARCGVLGPVLEKEFENALPRAGIEVLTGPVPLKKDGSELRIEGKTEEKMTARVGIISHIGGHKFAGNVIFYIPPTATLVGGEAHPLAGMGIWYGRVEPKHVEGLIKTTLQEGKVVEELLRGGVQKDKGVLHMPMKPKQK